MAKIIEYKEFFKKLVKQRIPKLSDEEMEILLDELGNLTTANLKNLTTSMIQMHRHYAKDERFDNNSELRVLALQRRWLFPWARERKI